MNLDISKLLENIELIYNRKNNMDTLIKSGYSEDINEYKLELVKGVYKPYDKIVQEIQENISKIKENHKKVTSYGEAIGQFKQYNVQYKFTKPGMPTVFCEYMRPLVNNERTFAIRFEYLKLKIDKDNYCEITLYGHGQPKNLDPIEALLYEPDIKFPNALWIDKITTATKDRGKGYMNILMCLAAKFANDILKADTFLLQPKAFDKTGPDTKTLITKVYPSFGFKSIQGDILNTMYASVKDMVNLGKCLDLQTKKV